MSFSHEVLIEISPVLVAYHSQSEQSFSSLLYHYLMPGLELLHLKLFTTTLGTNHYNLGTPGLKIDKIRADQDGDECNLWNHDILVNVI